MTTYVTLTRPQRNALRYPAVMASMTADRRLAHRPRPLVSLVLSINTGYE